MTQTPKQLLGWEERRGRKFPGEIILFVKMMQDKTHHQETTFLGEDLSGEIDGM